ncbi:MAG: thioesterase family protein [Phototrophicaceae bacterium]
MSDVPFVAEATFHVRYAETDAQQIVHHAAYIVYFEEGRSEFLRAQGTSYADFERSGFYLAVTSVEAKYLKASRYDDKLTVRCWISKSRSRMMQFNYEIIHSDTGELRVTGMTQHICLTHEGAIARIPDAWQKWV